MSQEKVTVENGIITGLTWSMDPVISHSIHLEMGSCGGSLGGYCLKGEAAYIWINQLIEVLDLTYLDDKKATGKVVRVEIMGTGLGRVTGIGHPIKDIWMRPKEMFAKFNEEK